MTRIYPINFSPKGFLMLLLVASMALTQGCAEYELRMKDSTPKRDLVYQKQTIHAYAWGHFYDPQTIMSDCDSPKRGINDVIVKRNYLYDLASVVTLGIWMPLEITYRCQSEKKGRGKLPGQ